MARNLVGFMLSIVLVNVYVDWVEGLRDIPAFLKICKTSDPHYDDCFSDSAMFLKPNLVNGIPEYNLPSLEPLVMDELIASENSAGLKISANNVKAWGASDFYITRMKADLEKQKYEGDVELPHLYVEANYAIDGKILLIPIKGNGPMKGNFTMCKGRVTFESEKYEKDGEEHIRFKNLLLRIKIGTGHVKLENLFGGEKVLGEVVNGAINSNFDAFIKELMPVIEKSLSKVFTQIANNIVEPFTYAQLFPKE